MDLTGKDIRKYHIQEKLGAGGMGTVYLARDTVLERNVALKVLTPTLASDDSFVERFRLEARALARLDHSAIVKVFDADWEENRLFIVMEYVEGGSLADLIVQEGALPPALVVQLLGQVAEGLDYAHRQGLIHRDIKPANILLDPTGNARITDFGLVKDPGSAITASGMRLGTPAYMAPEQIQGEDVSPALDIYALGVVAYEMLAGKPPFQGTMSKVFEGHLLREPPPLRQSNPKLPSGLGDVVRKALSKLPEERYGSASEFIRALDRAIDESVGIPARAVPPLPPVERHEPSPSGPAVPQGPSSGPIQEGAVSGGRPQDAPSGAISGGFPTGESGPPRRGFLSGLGLGAIGALVLGGLVLICICGGLGLWAYTLARETATSTPPPPTESVALQPLPTNTPLPVPTNTLPPPPTSTPLPAGPTILYQEDFSIDSGEWASQRDEDGITDFDQGGYRIQVEIADWFFWSTPGQAFSDVVIEVDATKLGGPDENEFGVICRYLDEDNFYFLTISSDMYFSVTRMIDGEFEFVGMDDFGQSRAINEGEVTNRIRAECVGETLRLYANGELLVEVQDDAFPAGDIGLIAGTYEDPGTDILFDNLVVTEP